MLHFAIVVFVCVVLPVGIALCVAGRKSDCTAFDDPALVCPCLQCSRGKQG